MLIVSGWWHRRQCFGMGNTVLMLHERIKVRADKVQIAPSIMVGISTMGSEKDEASAHRQYLSP
jgi:hypothetical protein